MEDVIHKSEWMTCDSNGWWTDRTWDKFKQGPPGPSNPVPAGCGGGIDACAVSFGYDLTDLNAGEIRYWLSFDPFTGSEMESVAEMLSWGEHVLETEDADRLQCVVAEHGVIHWKLEWREREEMTNVTA